MAAGGPCGYESRPHVVEAERPPSRVTPCPCSRLTNLNKSPTGFRSLTVAAPNRGFTERPRRGRDGGYQPPPAQTRTCRDYCIRFLPRMGLLLESGVEASVAHDGNLAPGRLPPPIGPLIQHRMQVHVGEQRRNHRALGRACFCSRPDAVLPDSSLQPFLDQAQNPRIGDSFLDELDQLFRRNVIEKAFPIQIENPAHRLPLDRHIQRIQRHMLPTPRSEPVTEPPKILFLYRVEDPNHGLLDDLILQRRNP
jgi:hypothetical protein